MPNTGNWLVDYPDGGQGTSSDVTTTQRSGEQVVVPLLPNSLSDAASTASLSVDTYSVDPWTGGTIVLDLTVDNATVEVIGTPDAGRWHKVTLLVVQDGTGGHTIDTWTGFTWTSGGAPGIALAPNAVTLIDLYADGAGTVYAARRETPAGDPDVFTIAVLDDQPAHIMVAFEDGADVFDDTIELRPEHVNIIGSLTVNDAPVGVDPTYVNTPDPALTYALDLEFADPADLDDVVTFAPTGTVDITQGRHGATVEAAQQNNDVAITVWPHAIAVGDAVETAFSVYLNAGDYWQAGVCVTSGVVGASAIVAAGLFQNFAPSPAIAAYNATVGAIFTYLGVGPVQAAVPSLFRARITRVDADTWAAEWSIDGAVWSDLGAGFTGDNATGMTHVGFFLAGGYQVDAPCFARFEYLRVYTV